MPEPDHFHANLQRGTVLLDHNRPKEALPFIQAAIAANPDAPYAYAELARCWNEIPPDRHKSIDAINRAIGLAPQVSHFHGRKGWFYVCLLQYRAAKKAADDGLAINPTCITSLNALANAHTKLAQWKQAEEACHRILALNPNDAPALNLLAQALRHQGRWKESRETIARLLATIPDNSFGHANAGFAALAVGDHLRANEHFLNSLRMNPNFELARRGLLLSIQARIWVNRLNLRIGTALRQPRSLTIIVLSAVGLLLTILIPSSLVASRVGHFPKLGTQLLEFIFFSFLFYSYFSLLVRLLSRFLLLFDPLGRRALSPREKTSACIVGLLFFGLVAALIHAHCWTYACALILILLMLAFSIQFPLLKDRWLRRREAESID